MEMIGVEESKDHFSLLTEESRPFDEIFVDFSSQFERGAPFKICFALTMLLKAACDDEAEHLEKAFIQLLMGSIFSNTFKEVLKLSAEDYMKVFDSSSYVLLPREQLQKQNGSRVRPEPYNTEFRSAALKNLVPDPDIPSIIGHGDRGAAITGLLQNLYLEGLGPQLVRPLPPRLPVLDGEASSFGSILPMTMSLYGIMACVDPRREAALRDLIAEALKGPLVNSQQKQVLVELSTDPKLVERCGITPQKLPELVENNSILAVEILKKLKGSDKISEYLSVLVNMDMNIRSMEVVKRVMTVVEFPRELVHVFIKNCISSCENIQEKYSQNAVVRLVCISLQGLIRKKTINVQDHISELQAFCTKFSQIPEASSLLKLL